MTLQSTEPDHEPQYEEVGHPPQEYEDIIHPNPGTGKMITQYFTYRIYTLKLTLGNSPEQPPRKKQQDSNTNVAFYSSVSC